MQCHVRQHGDIGNIYKVPYAGLFCSEPLAYQMQPYNSVNPDKLRFRADLGQH